MRRILVIDDSQDTRELMQLLLEHAGYTVEVAPDGAAGLRAQLARPADLVITDIFMPKQDGLETIAELRRRHPDLKVIAISGGGEVVKNPGYLLTARELGAHAVLAKPFDVQALLSAVRELLG
jgi:CheY-like chemotaxis protein